MPADILASFIYLGVLGLTLVGYVVLSARHSPSRAVQQAVIWALIFVGVIAGFGLWNDVRDTLLPRQTVFESGMRVEIPVASDGHFYLSLTINDTPVRFVVDTGASDLVLSTRDAARVGLRADELTFSGIASTANGTVQTAKVYLQRVELGGIKEFEVAAVVNGGALETSLLGMRYLRRWGRVEFDGDRMVLMR